MILYGHRRALYPTSQLDLNNNTSTCSCVVLLPACTLSIGCGSILYANPLYWEVSRPPFTSFLRVLNFSQDYLFAEQVAQQLLDKNYCVVQMCRLHSKAGCDDELNVQYRVTCYIYYSQICLATESLLLHLHSWHIL